MILDPRVTYPHAKSYLLKFHADADPQKGMFSGRLEHLPSGRQYYFGSVAELIACLMKTGIDESSD